MSASAPKKGEPLVRVQNLKTSYPASGWLGRGRRTVAVDEVSLSIAAGETLGLVGESGCGKTTLGRCVIRLIEPDAGKIEVAGRDFMALQGGELRRQRREMQIIFQDPYASLNPRMRIGETIGEPFRIHERMSRAERQARVAELLEAVGMGPEALRRYPHEFSGGQRQRIGIARALALKPKFIVADEPVSALDVSVGAQIILLLGELQKKFHLTYLFISHSLPVVAQIADRVAVMYRGKIVESGPTGAVLQNPLHPYTQLLRRSVPEVERQLEALRAKATAEKVAPGGCPFEPRCPLAAERCRAEEPALLPEGGEGRQVACHFV
jgi:oligopeptide/dipeptide ABC transporter ATP-binding protein